ncbi:hypothetical protein MUG84_06630 [Paenibacillus sp. KQZ6P-2]|uniref:Uncharacterized protein n=1 Tax=Paenibacillus mangrovi TaxID=2931978 RepID=A0A9X1WMM0_9BACL|nr:hypothetical protein [Paenibacillus mangrovi]MCJ8011421.1 hypothetical protein [Paenibacillus mangrovi]
MWILDNFYWILIIGFAILSALSKSGKSKQKQNSRGMPSFDGKGGFERRNKAPATVEAPRERKVEKEPDFVAERKAAERSFEFQGYGPDYETGEGVSGMWEAEEKPETLADYEREMQQHLNRVNASLDRIEKAATESYSKQKRRTEPAQPVSPLAKEARNGLIWAEILGPPRSKRPYSGRK